MKKKIKFLALIASILCILSITGCRTQFGRWFLEDDMNEVDPDAKHGYVDPTLYG